eukprot:3913511-Pleurochrysis_carterae.AAC.1
MAQHPTRIENSVIGIVKPSSRRQNWPQKGTTLSLEATGFAGMATYLEVTRGEVQPLARPERPQRHERARGEAHRVLACAHVRTLTHQGRRLLQWMARACESATLQAVNATMYVGARAISSYQHVCARVGY